MEKNDEVIIDCIDSIENDMENILNKIIRHDDFENKEVVSVATAQVLLEILREENK